VLRKDNIAEFQRVRDRGVQVTVVTNSLASNNHTVSHSGYLANRKRLLEMGIKLYELRASTEIPADESAGVQESKKTLHAKTFTVDREKIFIGSFNWNQRSSNLDTELGVIIHSPEIARTLVEQVSAALPTVTFEVYLDDRNRVRWRGLDDGREVILKKEPQSGFWRRFSAGFLRFMPIKGQL